MRTALMTALLPSLLAAQEIPVSVSPSLGDFPGPLNEPWVTVSPTNTDILLTAAQQGDRGKLGQLLRRDLSEPVSATLPVARARGLDAGFDFTVTGRQPRRER